MEVLLSRGTELDELAIRNQLTAYFYVVPKARGAGVGGAAARALLERHHGAGLLFTLVGNTGAQRFWRTVLGAAASDVRENGDATEFRFTS